MLGVIKMIKRKPSPTLTALQSENTDLKKLIQQFKLEISHLQAQKVKLEVKYFSAQERIKALQTEKPIPKGNPISNTELAAKIIYILKRAGIKFHGLSFSKNNKKNPQPVTSADRYHVG
jgi:hypothetical protein